jgi:hypothetical protein
MRLIIRV